MARKTKTETELTRRLIIEAARRNFAERGVRHTTLEQIAEAAGVTRGAIYWHFANKSEILLAVRDDVAMPLLERLENLLMGSDGDGREDPLGSIEEFLHTHIDRVTNDPATRQTFEIMFFKCEYTGEFGETLRTMVCKTHGMEERLTAAYRAAASKGQLRLGTDPAALARDTYAFLVGIVRLSVGPGNLTSPETTIPVMIRDHIALRRG